MNTEQLQKNNTPQPCLAKLRFKNAPLLDAVLLEKILRAVSHVLEGTLGAVQHRILPGKKDLYSAALLLLPERLEATDAGPAGLLLRFGGFNPSHDDPDLSLSLEQTWQWDDAGAAAGAAPFCLSLSELNALHLAPAARLALFQKSLYALAAELGPAALHFPQSQCLIDPEAYLENRPGAPEYFRLHGLVNTRIFVPRTSGATALLMDTLGLHCLGLPDFQLRVTEETPDCAELACRLCNLADYLCSGPGELRDGVLVSAAEDAPGVAPWELRRAQALMPPARVVLELLPAGGRN
ncbi:MAG: DUF4261 domain-containing protein [Deltaproteobacteria bacterium]|jgi:hypothetical protein|nr:DUF4261 domain-containing protein [Deltaproteobacteria bacterium]